MTRDSETTAALLLIWALEEIASHQPQNDWRTGLSCDERGCVICNRGGATDAEDARFLVDCAEESGRLPDDSELADALEAYAERLRANL